MNTKEYEGKEQKIMKKKIVLALIATATMTFGNAVSILAMDAGQFTDVKPAWSYFSEVENVVDNELMSGTTDTEFGVSEKISRIDLVDALHKMAKSPLSLDVTSFEDVKRTDNEIKVTWAEHRNLFSGLKADFFVDGNFDTEKELTREETAVILYNYAINYDGLDVNRGIGSYDYFSDKETNKVSDEYATAMQWAVGNQILLGDDKLTDDVENALRPTDTINKVELANALSNYMKLRDYLNAEKQNNTLATETAQTSNATVLPINVNTDGNNATQEIAPEVTPEVEKHEHNFVDNMVDVNHPEEGHYEKELVKDAWTETVEHEAEYEDRWVEDEAAVYEDVYHEAEYEDVFHEAEVKHHDAITEAVYHPPVTHEVFHPAITHEVTHPAGIREVFHPAETHEVFHPAVTHEEFHPAETQDVFHPAVTHDVFHPAVTHEVNHPAITHDVFHPAVTHDVFHPAVTHTEYHYICNNCGADMGMTIESVTAHIDYHSSRLESIGYAQRLVEVVDQEAWTETIVDAEAWTETVVDQEAWTETVVDAEAWTETIVDQEAWTETVTIKEAWTETVIDELAWTETVVDKEAWTEYIEETAPWVEVVVDKEAWTEIVLDKAGYTEIVTIKEAWDETIREAYTESVLVKEAYTEKVLVTPATGHFDKVMVKEAWVETIEHPAEYKDVWVVDKPAYTETIKDGVICTDCGEVVR